MMFIIITLLFGAIFKYKFSSKSSFLLFLLGMILHYTSYFREWKDIESEVILIYMIPPLIYYSSAHINIHILKQFIKQLFVLNGPILVLCIILTGLFFSLLEDLPWKLIFIFSTIISATDPVTIIHILEHLNMSKKIKTLIDGDALLNDAAIYLIYSLLLMDNTNTFIFKIFYIPLGSIILSCVLFFIFFNIMKRIYDSDIEITLSFIFCYGGFYLAENVLEISGIFVIVMFGLWVSYLGKTSFSSSIKNSMEHVWETIDINMNHIIITLSGLIGMKTIYLLSEKWWKLLLLFIMINIIRISVIMMFSKFLIHEKYRIFKKQLFLIGLGNIKGAITILLALELSETEDLKIILFYAYGIVFLSLLINPLLVYLFIKHGIKHEYDETVEYILHIRNKLQRVGYDLILSFRDKSNLQTIQWNQVEKQMIKPVLVSRSKDDGIELNIQDDKYLEYRVIYLSSLKENFWILFEDHQLYRDTLIYLLELVDTILDSQDKHWASCFQRYCHLPEYYSWVPEWYIRKVLYHNIKHTHNILSGYILGHKYTLENLDCIFEMDCQIINELKNEMEMSIREATETVNKIEELYPEITQKIETRQALHYVLKNQQKFLKRIFKEGKINYYIFNHINREIDNKCNH